ncbi:MAG: RNA 2',3'-cyclic phosphodiesterase [Thaumarchaeota archaeon]|nr:RNA 2',3'-cyclic phosphodiesterase [Nitrososphaerota archaeon]
MRAFVALEIPDRKVMESIVRFQDEVRATGADVKLVERQNLHFTIRFLGEVTPEQASEADRRLKELGMKGEEVEVKGTGAFPGSGRPSVLWVGVADPDEEKVLRIAARVNELLDGLGESDDRPFRAHLTLGRVRSQRGSGSLTELLAQNAGRSFGRVRLSELKLKSSQLTPSGPVYTDVGAYPLP